MLSKLQILLLIMLILMATYLIKNKLTPKAYMLEGFEPKQNSSNFEYMTKISDIYDDFYCRIYDDLMVDSNKINYEMNMLIKLMAAPLQRNHEITALDVGSGTGHHVSAMNQNNIKCIGIDLSPNMVANASKNYPDCTFINDNVENTMIFQPSSFNLITCFFYTFYYLDDKERFLANCYQWLKPGGTLVLHVVNRKKFSPIISASDPLLIISPQNYTKERITESVAEFNNFQYKANFDYDESKNTGVFNEIFKFHKKKGVRQNEHRLKMVGIKPVISQAKRLGFNLIDTTNLGQCGYDYQYLLVLRKK